MIASTKVLKKRVQNKLFFDIFQIYFDSTSVSYWKPATCNFKTLRKHTKTHRKTLCINHVISRANKSDLFTFLRPRPISPNTLALHAAREITSIWLVKLFLEVDCSIHAEIALFPLQTCQRANVPFRFFMFWKILLLIFILYILYYNIIYII